jgi:hypothetical protein
MREEVYRRFLYKASRALECPWRLKEDKNIHELANVMPVKSERSFK